MAEEPVPPRVTAAEAQRTGAGEITDTGAPALSFVADIRVDVGEPVTIGHTGAGLRRVIPILGGSVQGPRLAGRVVPGGADFQNLRTDGVMELEAKYVLEATNGALIYVVNRGLRRGP